MSNEGVGSSSGVLSEAVSRAEALLASFWSTPDGPEQIAKVRAATMNYVVLCAPQDADGYREATERLSETHGGRTLLLTMSGRIAPWDLVPDIHAVCRIDGAVPICYDRVDLTFGAAAASRAASVVSTLVLPELKTLVEVGPGAPSPLVDAVAGKFDRLIIDSARTNLLAIAKILVRAACPVADRAMIRQYAWRELTARAFDDAPAAAFEIRRVEITRTRPREGGGASHGELQDPASIFLGWLGSRLGWTFVNHVTARDSRGEPIDIALSNDEQSELPPGQLTAVRLRCTFKGEPLEVSIERLTSAPAVRWRLRGARCADREHALGFRDETWVTVKAIDSTEGDAVARATLLAAANWEAVSGSSW